MVAHFSIESDYLKVMVCEEQKWQMHGPKQAIEVQILKIKKKTKVKTKVFKHKQKILQKITLMCLQRAQDIKFKI